jgi:hypothetical protein
MNGKCSWLWRGVVVMAALACAVAMGPAPASAQCEPDDQFAVFIVDGMVTVIHEHAEYNCCMDGCEYAVELAGDIIDVVETEVVSLPCWCLCCFWLQVQIADVPPGDYTVRFHWCEGYDDWQVADLPIVVPDNGQGDEPSIAACERSDCYSGSTAVPPDAPLPTTWAQLKAGYR